MPFSKWDLIDMNLNAGNVSTILILNFRWSFGILLWEIETEGLYHFIYNH